MNEQIWESAIKNSYQKFSNLDKERAITELGYAYQILQGSTQLQSCSKDSIENSIINVARTSVTLNPVMKLAYLVPRKGKCVLDFSYMGMVAMLRDYGCVRNISAHIVYEDETFINDIHSGILNHTPKYPKTEEEHKLRVIFGCYTRAVLPNGDIAYEFMPNWEILKVKDSSFGSNHKDSAWTTWKEEMYKKSVIRRHFKTLLSMGNNIANDKLSAMLSVENENNPLINDFNKPKANVNKLSNAFIEEQQLLIPKEKTINDLLKDQIEPEPIKVVEVKKEPIKVVEVKPEPKNETVKIKKEVNGVKANEVVDTSTGEVLEFSDEEMGEFELDFDFDDFEIEDEDISLEI